MMLQSKYHLINSINKINKTRGFEEIDFRFFYILENLFTYSRQISNDYIKWCYNSAEDVEINRESLNAFIDQYESKKLDEIKNYMSDLSIKADRKRVDNRKKPKIEEQTEFDLQIIKLQYLMGYRGRKGYISKDLMEMFKDLYNKDKNSLNDYIAYCGINGDKPEIIHFMSWCFVNRK